MNVAAGSGVQAQGSDADTAGELDFSLVADDPLIRAQRTIGLIPKRGLGVGRRVVIAIALTWLPLALWAVWHRVFLEGTVQDPLMRHFGIHARFLLALPLFFVAESVVDRALRRVLSQFISSGLVDETLEPRFLGILRDAARQRSSRAALAVIVVLIVAISLAGRGRLADNHELNWVTSTPGAASGEFATWWFECVARPIFLLVLVAWIWRMVVVTRMFWQIARLDLRLAPTHPDRAGGLGFVEGLPIAFTPFLLAVATVIAGRWAHDSLYHDVPVQSLRVPAGVLIAGSVCIGLAPLAAFVGKLMVFKRRSLIAVGALLADYGRLFERRWFRHESVDDAGLLGAPEIGPVADTVALYEAVKRMRVVPISRGAIIPLALAAAVPLIFVFATQVPLKQILATLLAPLTGL